MWMGLFKYMKLYQHLCDFLFVRKIFFSRSLHIMSSWHKEYLCLFLLCKSSEVNSQTAKIKCFHCSLFGQVVSWRSCSDLRSHPFVMHAGSSPHNHQFKNFILWESKKAQIWCNRPILTPTHKDCGCIAKNFDIFQMAAWHLPQFSLLEIFSINIHNVEKKTAWKFEVRCAHANGLNEILRKSSQEIQEVNKNMTQKWKLAKFKLDFYLFFK